MKKIISSFCAIVFFSCTLYGQSIPVHLNSIGFLPELPKTASIPHKSNEFSIINASNGKHVFSGKTTGPVYQKDVDQNVWFADFTGLKTTGTYYVEVPGVGRSAEFVIAEDALNSAAKTSFRAFYLWRCGMAVHGEHNGHIYETEACHLNDGYEDYIGQPGSQRNGTGGWHDAGDHGKYTVNAGVTLGILFYAWDHFGQQLDKLNYELPETAPAYPEFLKELKWETDWLLKMPYPDGSGRVSHKLTRTNFSGFIMPQHDDANRYFTVWSSAATADFVALMAMAARTFKPYDAEYAQKCLDAAWVSYRFLLQNPEEAQFLQGDFKTGGYQTRDDDDRLWAAAEMWETTGDPICLKDFEERAAAMEYEIDENWDWSDVSNMGMFTYALSERKEKSEEVESVISKNIVANADALVKKGKEDVYGRPLADRYYWGCNGTVARQTVNLQVANKLKPDAEYVETALKAVNHILGNNYYNRSYVTGIGIQPPLNPHDRRSGADDVEDPWPGYIVGGGHSATDWVDIEESYSHNEVAINWQAAFVYALAGFIK